MIRPSGGRRFLITILFSFPFLRGFYLEKSQQEFSGYENLWVRQAYRSLRFLRSEAAQIRRVQHQHIIGFQVYNIDVFGFKFFEFFTR